MTTRKQKPKKKIASIAPQKGKQTLAWNMCSQTPEQKAKGNVVDFMIYGGARGAGKALPLSEDIPTPNGFRKLHNLKEGDFVFDHNGEPTRIIKLHPIEMQDSYKLIFSDGSTISCSGEHKWEYWLANTGSRNKHTVTNTISLMDLVNEAKTTSKTKKYPLIPILTKEVEFSEYYTEIDPYLLGLILGDGCISENANLTITTIDTSIIDYITAKHDVSIDCKNGTKAKSVRFKGADLINLKASLKSLGLYGKTSIDKFIPEHYLINSKEIRYNLLQGLLDTDGTVDKRGDVYFYSISENLVKGVVSLVESLGGVCTVTQKKGKYKNKQDEIITCNTCYSVRIKHKYPEKLFKLQRKREKVTGFQGFYRKLIDVSIHKQVPMRCITVENERGLFLATYRFIVTHNSELLAMLPLAHIKDPKFEGIFFRRSYPELTGSGGLWQKAGKMYPEFKASKNISNLKYIFPSGANVKFSHMQHEDDKESHRGLQYSFVGFDEIDQFSKEQVIFLLTCLRSEANMDSFCVGTCNPNPD